MTHRFLPSPRPSFRALLAVAALLVLSGLLACGGGGPSAERVEAGHELFKGTCATCHGVTARGVPNQGKNLHDNEFVQSRTDEEMLAFLKVGRRASHELNTTGVDMPPKGGNPALTEEDLRTIIVYLRSLQNGQR